MVLEFRWTVSRGRETYGYNICSLYVDGHKVAACNGGGYDMQGTCLGIWLAKAYPDRLRALKQEQMPAQSHWNSNHRRVCRGECYEKFILELTGDTPPANLPDYDRDTDVCPVCGGEMSYADLGHRVDDGRYFYGLTFHDPNYDPSKAVIGKDCSDRTLTLGNEGSDGKTVEQAEADGVSLGLERYQAIYAASSKHATERHTVPSIDGGVGMSSVCDIAKAIGIELRYVPTKSKKLTIYEVVDTQAV